jgi:hypothetical protein
MLEKPSIELPCSVDANRAFIIIGISGAVE